MFPQMAEVSKTPKSGAEGTPLGITAKLPANDPMLWRVERFALQSVARKVVPKTRTAVCMRSRAKGAQVQIWRSVKHSTACYQGLQTCGSVWTCPVCAAKIAERRKQELLGAMKVHEAQGGFVQLLTLTTPHTRADDLGELLARQGKALAAFRADRAVKAVFAEMGHVGQVRALEVTHGRKSGHNNGWHPHFHILQFCDRASTALERNAWEDALYERWARFCEKQGLGKPSREHGIRLDDGSKATAYVTKWGLEDEMTKGHTKRGKDGGETPFDLLRALLDDPKDKQAAALFREYAQKFKGKQQLSWSNGLKNRLKVSEMSDAEILAAADDKAEFLCQIALPEWRLVLRRDARGELIAIAARQGWEGVTAFLDSLVKVKREAFGGETAGFHGGNAGRSRAHFPSFGVLQGREREAEDLPGEPRRGFTGKPQAVSWAGGLPGSTSGGIGGIAPDVQPLSRDVPGDKKHQGTSAPVTGIELGRVPGEQRMPQLLHDLEQDGGQRACSAERTVSRPERPTRESAPGE